MWKDRLTTRIAALVVALIACVLITAISARFLLAPRTAMLGDGIDPQNLRALTEIQGARDITSGVVMLVVWAAAGRTALGWALIAVALTPTAEALIVLTNGGKLPTALGIHGITAALLIAAGLLNLDIHGGRDPLRQVGRRTCQPRSDGRATFREHAT